MKVNVSCMWAKLALYRTFCKEVGLKKHLHRLSDAGSYLSLGQGHMG